MKLVTALSSALFFVCTIGFSSLPPTRKVVSLQQIGNIKVGSTIEHCHSILKEQKQLRGEAGQRAPFYVYYFRSGLPMHCMNLQCGPFARQITSRGGFLIGGRDIAYSKELGVSFDQSSVQSPQSLLFITDTQGKVSKIYRDVSDRDLDYLLN